MIKNSEILSGLKTLDTELGTDNRKQFLHLLQKRPMRTLSGVTPIALMIKPGGSCPYKCIYCPTGIGAKSYTGYEPAALRARQEEFDPFKQVQNRITHYTECGHQTSKCEIIVMGGTFLQMPGEYKQSFIKGVYDALNGQICEDLQAAKKLNETSIHRCVGLTIETRPDVCAKEEIDEMLGFGATRVELGVQHPDDSIYKTVKRGHKTTDVIHATKLLKDSAFKICYHLMPGLPGSNKKKDIAMVKGIFAKPEFRPDMLKIYPTLVMPKTPLEEMMKKGKFVPYTSEQAAEVISEFYRYIPEYVRVMRIMRDIPANLIGSGTTKSNLRELVEKRINEKGIQLKEIRSREIGLRGEKFNKDDFALSGTQYSASKGEEVFLSYENKENLIAGFLRLRIPDSPFRDEINEKTALVRELHIYGAEIEVGEKGKVQHTGIGARLLSEAEKMAKEEFDKKKMTVISGIGAREYYRKLGYRNDGSYVSKVL
jgi:elongator complex protein 3